MGCGSTGCEGPSPTSCLSRRTSSGWTYVAPFLRRPARVTFTVEGNFFLASWTAMKRPASSLVLRTVATVLYQPSSISHPGTRAAFASLSGSNTDNADVLTRPRHHTPHTHPAGGPQLLRGHHPMHAAPGALAHQDGALSEPAEGLSARLPVHCGPQTQVALPRLSRAQLYHPGEANHSAQP